MKLTKLVAAASALFLMGGAAQSADLYTPVPDPAPVYTGGWYFSGFGGANWLDNTSFDVTLNQADDAIVNKYDTGFVVGGAIGYDLGQTMGPLGLRIEGELSYRNNDVKSHTSTGGGAAPGPVGETSALAGMANILFDLNTGSPFSLYGGGGIGVAQVEFDNHGFGNGSTIVMDDSDTVFAWQLIAGAGYEITPNMILDVQYRYFNAGDVSIEPVSAVSRGASSTDYESHAVLGGIRFKF